MAIPVQGVSELVIEVADMDRAIMFWSETLGFPIVDQWGYANGQFTGSVSGDEIWATWIYVGGNTRLGLWLPREFSDEDKEQKAQPVNQWPDSALYDEGGDHVHFALYIDESEFDTTHEFLQQADVPVTKREYAAEVPYQSLYFKDPDEHVVELYTRPMNEDYQLDNSN